eukprot:CAMPEP_0172157302 /NCGR_PEP_ID=MMETSP1050-20130122/3708_1 /TAXON_ID=233186 /ORGANISM="Cryptomonas curvata, Strain CCAP979/52" /LENGTH=40 /DNA_ID= /DNA_START= /DNA_END= /DNA_ORIENTATION=
MFQQAMKEQGQTHSSTADVMKAGKSKSLDAWAASGGMPRV